ncbi:MAG: GNAT family N-acetyltransferase [Nitrosomonadales bacterium]|nr:MAG: GNAT family N-acetyltransferase [Nitrosomonadales bacterium]
MNTVKYSNFDQLPSHCLELLAEVEHTNFFFGRGWFENFSRNTIDPTAQIHIYTVEDNTAARPKARAVLFMRSAAGQAGSLFERKFCGSNSISSMTAHQTLFFAPAIRETDDQYSEVISALIGSICKDDRSWDVIDLNFLDPNSRVYGALIQALKRFGLSLREYYWRACICEDVSNTTYANYLASRSKAVKKTYVYKQRKLAKTEKTRFEMITGGENLESGIEDYEHVLANSWKGAEPFPNHAAGLIRAAAAAGALRLGLYYIENTPVATHLWIVTSGRATICKHHHDSKYDKESVGAILTMRMFEYAIDTEKVHTIDFGVGDEPAKRYWLNEEESICGVVAFNDRSLRGLMSLFLYTISEKIDQIKKKIKTYLPLRNRSLWKH